MSKLNRTLIPCLYGEQWRRFDCVDGNERVQQQDIRAEVQHLLVLFMSWNKRHSFPEDKYLIAPPSVTAHAPPAAMTSSRQQELPLQCPGE